MSGTRNITTGALLSFFVAVLLYVVAGVFHAISAPIEATFFGMVASLTLGVFIGFMIITEDIRNGRTMIVETHKTKPIKQTIMFTPKKAYK